MGFVNIADDLGSLAAMFTEYWAQVRGEELGEAKRLRHSAAEYLRRGIEDVRAAVRSGGWIG